MARFRGTVRGGRTEASRLGHATTGLTVNAATWTHDVHVELWTDEEDLDMVRVTVRSLKGSDHRILYVGPISDATRPPAPIHSDIKTTKE